MPASTDRHHGSSGLRSTALAAAASAAASCPGRAQVLRKRRVRCAEIRRDFDGTMRRPLGEISARPMLRDPVAPARPAWSRPADIPSPLAWRLDKLYERMRSEVPHLGKRPSEYIRRHIWVTTQPMEEPEDRQHLFDTMEWIGWDRLLFASDYPHWDFDDPFLRLPRRFAAGSAISRS